MPLPGKQMPGHAACQLDQRRRPWRLVPCHEFLFVVSLLPFSAALLAHYVHLRLAVGVYWLNILLLGVGLEAGAWYGRTTLVPGDDRQALSRLATFRRRILQAQTLPALAALVCLISTQASVIALAVVQLYNIVSPGCPA